MEYLTTKVRWMLNLLCIAVFTISGHAFAADSIGHIIYTTGKVQAMNNGKVRTLKRGSKVYEGDTVRAGQYTQSQLRMTDGALIAVRANSELRFDEYRYSDNDQSTASSIFSLVKGGFRTISGLIGKINRKNYRVKTSVATIGIRGTHYGLTLCEQSSCNEGEDGPLEDGLYGSVIDGEIVTVNDAGTFSFSNDEYFHLSSRTSRPKNLLKPPNIVFGQGKLAKLKKMQQKTGDSASMTQRRGTQMATMLLSQLDTRRDFFQQQLQPVFETVNDQTDDNSAQFLPSPQGSVLGFTFFETDLVTGTMDTSIVKIRSDGTTTNTFNLSTVALNNNLLIPVRAVETTTVATKQLLFADAEVINPMTIQVPGTTTADGRSTTVGWGRWSTGYKVDENGIVRSPGSQLHYIVASDTTTLAQLGGLTGTASYTTVIGGTRATDKAGIVAPALANVNMAVDFGNNLITQFGISTTVDNKVYAAQLPKTGGALPATIPIQIDTALKDGIIMGPTSACLNCSGEAGVAFLGPQAQGAATIYSIKNNLTQNAVNGTAVLLDDNLAGTMAK